MASILSPHNCVKLIHINPVMDRVETFFLASLQYYGEDHPGSTTVMHRYHLIGVGI